MAILSYLGIVMLSGQAHHIVGEHIPTQDLHEETLSTREAVGRNQCKTERGVGGQVEGKYKGRPLCLRGT